ncbi:MoaD/ThiS family protein [Catellatospora sp. KI3]|uniref:MoaD/ThiS family protein n=1 Tax=Catellatospora sp. KI3 TaxID=3041620 RepID=UPI0024827DCB|nr:MoaD/ThiS family protein [Catellatospora sp. KI3]MDI1461715.1 MoaD/ThiS family protein [Catellatospora sp. KI3]
MITVRFFAGARAAAGVPEGSYPAGLDLGQLIKELGADRGDGLARVLLSASFLVDGLAWHDRHAPIPAGATVDVLPPFAGG